MDAMGTPAIARHTAQLAMTLMIAGLAFTGIQAQQPPAAAPKPQALKGTAVRGCLVGSKLTQLEIEEGWPTLPDSLRVTSIRVIRSQLKALNGHRVELIGTLQGIPGMDKGLLVADSDKGKFYIGGA